MAQFHENVFFFFFFVLLTKALYTYWYKNLLSNTGRSLLYKIFFFVAWKYHIGVLD